MPTVSSPKKVILTRAKFSVTKVRTGPSLITYAPRGRGVESFYTFCITYKKGGGGGVVGLVSMYKCVHNK